MPIVVVTLLAFLFVGCGPSSERAILTTTAYAVVQADKSFAEAYELASAAARDASATQAEKDARMVEWDAAADEVDRLANASYASLAAAEIALDVAEQTSESDGWHGALGCIVENVRKLGGVLERRGLRVPRPLMAVLEELGGLECRRQ